MIYANKKISQGQNLAQQTAKIIANVIALEQKKFIRLSEDTVFLDRKLWQDKALAENWMNCLQRYYVVKKGLKKSEELQFRDIATEELIGRIHGSRPKLLIELGS